MRQYNKIQCIAFDIDTGHSQTSELPSYTGMENSDDDLEKRIWLMIDAINSPTGVDQNPDTLKIFMAPECFFRGKAGYYSIEQVSNILPKLRETVSAEKYRDWLFIFGTAVGGLDPTTAEHQLINAALVQSGGPDRNTERVVYKEYFSPVDFHSAQGTVMPPTPGSQEKHLLNLSRGTGQMPFPTSPEPNEEYRESGSGWGGSPFLNTATSLLAWKSVQIMLPSD